MVVECDCEDWKRDYEWLLSCQIIGAKHGVCYQGKIWTYCPWCGSALKERKLIDGEDTVH